MATLAQIPVGHEPYYELRVEGTRLRDDYLRHIRGGPRVRFDVDKAGMLQLTVDELVDGQATAEIIDGKAFAEGNMIEYWVSGGSLRPPICRGRFELMLPAVRGGAGGRTLEATGLTADHRLASHTDPFAADAKTLDHEIVATLAATHGLDADIDTGTLPRSKPRVKVAGTSDFTFLDELARTARNREGAAYRWWVRFDPNARGGRGADVLHFQPFTVDPTQEEVIFNFVPYYDDGGEWHATLRRFEATPALKGMPSKMVLRYTDLTAGEEREIVIQLTEQSSAPSVLFVGQAGKAKIEQEIKDGAAIAVTAFGGRDAFLGHLMFRNGEEAAAYGLALFREQQLAFVSLEAAVVGVETLMPWGLHLLRGMSSRLDGRYMITSVEDVWGGGDLAFAMDITANRVPDAKDAPEAVR